jgi:hypothetical protein
VEAAEPVGGENGKLFDDVRCSGGNGVSTHHNK